MIGTTTQERLAIALVVARLPPMLETIGWEKRLCELSESEIMALIEEVLELYVTQMRRINRQAQAPF